MATTNDVLFERYRKSLVNQNRATFFATKPKEIELTNLHPTSVAEIAREAELELERCQQDADECLRQLELEIDQHLTQYHLSLTGVLTPDGPKGEAVYKNRALYDQILEYYNAEESSRKEMKAKANKLESYNTGDFWANRRAYSQTSSLYDDVDKARVNDDFKPLIREYAAMRKIHKELNEQNLSAKTRTERLVSDLQQKKDTQELLEARPTGWFAGFVQSIKKFFGCGKSAGQKFREAVEKRQTLKQPHLQPQ